MQSDTSDDTTSFLTSCKEKYVLAHRLSDTPVGALTSEKKGKGVADR